MSFPTSTQLTNVPFLAEWLMARAWEEGISVIPFQMQPLVVVVSIRFATLAELHEYSEENETILMARCRDAGARVYNTQLIFFEEYQDVRRRGTLEFVSECSCNKVFSCSHALAAFEKLRSIVSQKPSASPALADAR